MEAKYIPDPSLVQAKPLNDAASTDEDTPVAALQALRPDVFVKGADYRTDDLPEAAVLAQWGGEAVVVPYLGGRSTTRLVEKVVSGATR